MKSKIYGVIVIESDSIKLKISEKRKDAYKILEDIKVEVNLGSDLLHYGKILRESVNELTDCLSKFISIIESYKVEKYKILATGIIREAPKGKLIMELLESKLDIEIDIVEDTVEHFLTYLSLNKNVGKKEEGAMYIEIAANACELIIFKNGKIVVNSGVPVGTLEMQSLMKGISKISTHVPEVLEEYVCAMSENLNTYFKRKKIKNLIIYSSNIFKLIEDKKMEGEVIPREILDDIFDKAYKSDSKFKDYAESLHLNYDSLICEIIILKYFYKKTKNPNFILPSISFRDGVIYAMDQKYSQFNRENPITLDILLCTKQLAKHFNSTLAHISAVEASFIQLFDIYSEYLSFSERDLLIGRMAAILHEIGKFSRQLKYKKVTYRAITNANILGVNRKLLNEVAEVTLLYLSLCETKAEISKFAGKSTKHIRLALLLSLADALDKSKQQKIKISKALIHSNTLKLNIYSEGRCILEKWQVDELRDSFMDVLGHEIVLIEK